jgi:hypothetical protein
MAPRAISTNMQTMPFSSSDLEKLPVTTSTGAARSAGLLVVLALLGCGKEPAPGPALTTSSGAVSATPSLASAPSSSAGARPATSIEAAASAAPPQGTIAALRADAVAEPARFKNTKVALDGYFVSQSQRSYGSGEHPVHRFAVVQVALGKGEADSLACEMREDTWPPLGLAAGDPVAVSGLWSVDRTLLGGWAEGGGPLHIADCKVVKRPAGGSGER